MASQARKIEPRTASTKNRDNSVEPSVTKIVNEDEIATRAYELWHQRGCPIGSPELDWLQAEEELRKQTEPIATAA